MSHYRKVDVRIWNDAKFNSLNPNGKLAFFMVLTHPMGSMPPSLSRIAWPVGALPCVSKFRPRSAMIGTMFSGEGHDRDPDS